MKRLLFGSRHWTDVEMIANYLDQFKLEPIPPDMVVTGDGRGADTIVYHLCRQRGIPVLRFNAKWSHYHDGAGPIRNQWMLEALQPGDIGTCWTDGWGRGSQDMACRLLRAGHKVSVYSHTGTMMTRAVFDEWLARQPKEAE